MSTFYAPSGISVKPYPYEDFQGIDASRDKTALDTGQRQHMISIRDGFADWRGSIIRDPGAVIRGGDNRLIQHVAFFGRDLAVWAQKDGGGVTLKSERDHEQSEVYPRESIITSTVFNHKVIFACRDHPMYQYDGFKWEKIFTGNDNRPAYIAPIQRRLATAGHPGKPGIVDLSRVDDESIFTADEDVGATAVTKASDIDVGNIIGTADEIRGISKFEANRMAVFTYDQTLIYIMHPDYTQWSIDDKSNVKVGTISHNSVAEAGGDLLFCSRDGVNSIRRSNANGVTLYSLPMSSKIDLTYRKLLRSVEDYESISSYYDPDNGQYHVFFPQSDLLTTRLTLTLSNSSETASKWSTASFLNARCGRHLGGVTVLGTPGGLWTRGQIEDTPEVSPELEVVTPILWQGSVNDVKESHSFLLQATGTGTLQVEAFDERARPLSTMQFQIEDDGEDDNFYDVPLSRQYDRKFEHRYRGVQFKFTAKGSGLMKIIGFAVLVRSS